MIRLYINKIEIKINALYRSYVILTALGICELVEGAKRWRVAYLIGSSEIRRRYVRSRLGQIWIMLSTAISVSAMGYCWSLLWHQPFSEMMPYIATSMIVWFLISEIIFQSTTVFTTGGHYFLNQYMPPSVLILALIYRSMISYGMNILFPLLIFLRHDASILSAVIRSMLGLLVVSFICYFVSFIIAILCLRFRDLIQIVNSLVQGAMFFTPVLWKPETLTIEQQSWVTWNPLALMIKLIRDPLLDRPIYYNDWLSICALFMVLIIVCMPLIGRYRYRIVYWI